MLTIPGDAHSPYLTHDAYRTYHSTGARPVRAMAMSTLHTTLTAPITLQVLDQFERNADQRRFLLSIFVTLEQRVERRPEDFAGLPPPL